MRRRHLLSLPAVAAGAATVAVAGSAFAEAGEEVTDAPDALAFDSPGTARLRASDKLVFGFYHPGYPIAIENRDPDQDFWASWNDPHGRDDEYLAIGGKMRDRPLATRPARAESNWRQLDFEVEIRQAIDMGLDGFIWEYHTISDNPRWKQLPAMLAAVAAVDPQFRIMLSPDIPGDGAIDQLVADVRAVADEPAILRQDDKIVLAPFYPERKDPQWWASAADRLASDGVQTGLVPLFLDWNGVDRKAWADVSIGLSLFGSRWASGADSNHARATESHDLGKLFMAPVAFEETRCKDLWFYEHSNSAGLRGYFEAAINGDSDWIMLRTWNDYEESWVAPSAKRGHAVGDLVAFYTTWLKTGEQPVVERDRLYYFHRSQPVDAPYDTGLQTGGPMALNPACPDQPIDRVELVAFVTGPATLSIIQGDEVTSTDATARGIAIATAPLVPGTTPRFTLVRDGETVSELTSGTPIRTEVGAQDIVYHAGSNRQDG